MIGIYGDNHTIIHKHIMIK